MHIFGQISGYSGCSSKKVSWCTVNRIFLIIKLFTVVTPGLLLPDCYILGFFAIFLQIFEKIRPKTLLKPKKCPDCYTFLTFFLLQSGSHYCKLLYLIEQKNCSYHGIDSKRTCRGRRRYFSKIFSCFNGRNRKSKSRLKIRTRKKVRSSMRTIVLLATA